MKSSPITLQLSRFLSLILRHDDYIELPIEEAVLISELDKNQAMVHVEFPSDDNDITAPRCYTIAAWRVAAEKHEKAKRRAAITRLEIDNLKVNIEKVATRLIAMAGMPQEAATDVATMMLRRGPADLSSIGVQLVHPYYKGIYTVLPTKHNGYSVE